MLIAPKAMSKGVEVLKPVMARDVFNSLGTGVIGTVVGSAAVKAKELIA
ncbi:hypothetical protein [Acetobacterium wieringae]